MGEATTAPPPPSDDAVEAFGPGGPTADFVQLFTRSQRRIYLFILSQVQSPVQAEEILQDTNVIVLAKHMQFQPGTNFLAWACQIANYEILKFRARRRREKLVFNDDVLQLVAAEALARSDELETRRAALMECLGKLRPRDRELIQTRYAPGHTGKEVAADLGRPANSVYQSLGRIRRTLWECIQRRLAAEGAR